MLLFSGKESSLVRKKVNAWMSVQNSYGLHYGKLWQLREMNSDLSGRTLFHSPSTGLSSQLEKYSNGLMPSWSGLVPRRKLEQVMKKLTRGDQQILFMLIWLLLTRVETEEISNKRLGSCFHWTCFRGWGESVGGPWNWIYTFLEDYCWEVQMQKNGVAIKKKILYK